MAKVNFAVDGKAVTVDVDPNMPLLYALRDDLKVGMKERLRKTIAASDVVGFAQLTGDRNPIHLSEHFAARTPFGTRIAHGLYTAGLISAVLGTRLPGPGAVYISQTLNFRAPVRIGDVVDVTVTVAEQQLANLFTDTSPKPRTDEELLGEIADHLGLTAPGDRTGAKVEKLDKADHSLMFQASRDDSLRRIRGLLFDCVQQHTQSEDRP